MATIGNISIAFDAETGGLTAGVSTVLSSLDGIKASVEELRSQLSGLSSLTVSVNVDSSGIKQAAKSVAAIKSSAEEASADVSVTADSSAIASAAESVEELGAAIQEASTSASGARSSIASLVVATGAVVTAVQQAVGAYGEFRQGFLDFLTATTGARTATGALRTVFRGLAGDVDALRAVFGGVKAGVDNMVSAFFSASNINSLLQGTLGNLLRLFGVADDAVVSSTQAIADLVTRQVSLAASHRLVQRSLEVVSSAYDSATASLVTFLTETATGQAVADGLSRAIVGVTRAAVSIDSTVSSAVASVRSFITSTELMGRVSAAVGTAFDELAAAARGMVSGVSSLGDAFAAIQLRLSLVFAGVTRLIPSLETFASAASTTVSVVGRAAAGLNQAILAFRSMGAAADGSASQLIAITANAAATSTAIGALVGALTSVITGAGLFSSAASGAAAALGGLAAGLPAFAAAAAVANVAFSDLSDTAVRFRQHIGQSAQQLGDLADRFGQPVQEMERLRIAADNAGVSITLVTRAQQNFYSSLSKVKIGQLGTEQAREAKAAFDRLKISVDDLNEASPEEVFERVAKQLSEIEDPAQKTQLAMDLFGRTGPALLPMLKSMSGLSQEIDRLGGLISDIDFKRFNDMNASFDRLRVASGALADDLQIPFVRMQEAMNNAGAELRGGFAQVFGAVGEMIADATTPVAVLIEMFGRVTGTVLRFVAAVLKLVGVFQVFATVAAVAEIIGDRFNDMWSYVEAAAKAFEDFASAVEEALGDSVEAVMSVGEALTKLLNIFPNIVGLGDVFGPVTASILAVVAAITWAMASSQAWTMVMGTTAGAAIASAAATAAAWVGAAAAIAVGVTAAAVAIGVYYVGLVISATATTIASCIAMHVAWLFGLGPIGLVIAAVELLVAGLAALWAMGGGIVDFFTGWGEGKEKIDGATASTEELAAAVAENEKRSEPGILKDMEAVARAAGVAEEDIVAFKAQAQAALEGIGFEVEIAPSAEEAAESIQAARDGMAELSIDAASFGQVGADAVASASEEFNDLQRSLAEGDITLEQFNEEAARLEKSLSDSLDAARESSPEEVLKRNLELFKQLDDAAKSAAKTVREIGAGVQIGDKFFPRSEEVKARAKEYSEQYASALDEIKKKLASGGFQEELDAKRAENDRAFGAGEIDSQTFRRRRRELDNTTAQEEASIAAEEVQRELDRQNAKLKVDLDFADNIRKSLETAFLSPVELFQKELKKIQDNPELTDEEKGLAEKNLRKSAREQLIGKTAVESFSDRQRDIQQGADAGLISNEEMRNEMLKNADELARALGIPVNPANQMEVAISELDTALKAGKISVEQHAEGLKSARRSFLESLGIKPAAEELDADRMAELEKQRAAGKISKEEFDRGRQAIQNDIVGQSAGDRIAEQRRRIEAGIASGAVDQERGDAALRSLDADQRRAAGVRDTAGQQLQAGIDKINDAFGTTGIQTEDDARAQLNAGAISAEQFDQISEALKNNLDSIRESLGVEKSPGQVLADAEKRLSQAVSDGVISQEEANEALQKQRDDILASLGVDKSPIREFEQAAERLADAAGEKAITEEELAEGARKIRDNLLSSLGIPLDPVNALRERMGDLQEAFAKGLITQEEFTKGQAEARRSMLPGGEAKSPVEQFREDLDAVNRAVSEGLISDEEGAQRRLNLQADLQENLKPALDSTAADRRLVGASDARSKEGVDTFFRILQGRDNPSLKAQQEIARNTRLLAQAAEDPDAAPVIAQLQAR